MVQQWPVGLHICPSVPVAPKTQVLHKVRSPCRTEVQLTDIHLPCRGTSFCRYLSEVATISEVLKLDKAATERLKADWHLVRHRVA